MFRPAIPAAAAATRECAASGYYEEVEVKKTVRVSAIGERL